MKAIKNSIKKTIVEPIVIFFIWLNIIISYLFLPLIAFVSMFFSDDNDPFDKYINFLNRLAEKYIK